MSNQSASSTLLDTFPSEPAPRRPVRSGHHGRRPHSRLSWWVVAAVALVVAIAAIAWALRGPGLGEARAAVAVTGAPGAETITVTRGSLDADQLVSSLSRSGHADLLGTTAGGARQLTADLVVGRGAQVALSDVALLLSSTSGRQVQVAVRDGGSLTLSHDTVTSWTNAGGVDTASADGRPSITATGSGSQLHVTKSRVAYLGSSTAAPGLAWLDGARGSISGSTVSHDVRGAYAFRSGAVTIDSSTFSSSADDGVLFNQPGRGSSVSGSTVSSNGANGLSLDNAVGVSLEDVTAHDNQSAGVHVHRASGIAITRLVSHDNTNQGVSLVSAAGSRVSDSKLYDNVSGAAVTGGSVRITGTWTSGNTRDGVYVSGVGATLTASDDRFDHNGRAGLWLTHSSAAVTSSLFDRNDTGLRVDDAATLSGHRNTVTGSTKDGLALTTSVPGGFTGNTITGSELAAVSTPAKADLTSLRKANTMPTAKGGHFSRVRGSDES